MFVWEVGVGCWMLLLSIFPQQALPYYPQGPQSRTVSLNSYGYCHITTLACCKVRKSPIFHSPATLIIQLLNQTIIYNILRQVLRQKAARSLNQNVGEKGSKTFDNLFVSMVVVQVLTFGLGSQTGRKINFPPRIVARESVIEGL